LRPAFGNALRAVVEPDGTAMNKMAETTAGHGAADLFDEKKKKKY